MSRGVINLEVQFTESQLATLIGLGAMTRSPRFPSETVLPNLPLSTPHSPLPRDHGRRICPQTTHLPARTASSAPSFPRHPAPNPRDDLLSAVPFGVAGMRNAKVIGAIV